MGSGSVGLALIGVGRVGRGVLELALTRPWLDVRALVARDPANDGRPATDLVGGAPSGLRITTDGPAALRTAAPDVVIVATRSSLPDVLPHLRLAASSGARAILSTAEELACVRPGDSAVGDQILALPAETGTTIVAAGVNPGFVLDLWPLVLSGLAWDVRSLRARRVVDVSVFAPHTRNKLGIGHTPEAFARGVADGSIAGHIGFRESLRLLCAAMGREPERIVIDTLPVVADRRYDVEGAPVHAGTTIGASQQAEAWLDGQPWISIEMLLHAAPAEAGIRTTDETHLSGHHDLHVTLDPGCGAILSTAALLVNGIPGALAAPPGLYGPGDLPPAAPWLAATPPPVAASPALEAA